MITVQSLNRHTRVVKHCWQPGKTTNGPDTCVANGYSRSRCADDRCQYLGCVTEFCHITIVCLHHQVTPTLNLRHTGNLRRNIVAPGLSGGDDIYWHSFTFNSFLQVNHTLDGPGRFHRAVFSIRHLRNGLMTHDASKPQARKRRNLLGQVHSGVYLSDATTAESGL